MQGKKATEVNVKSSRIIRQNNKDSFQLSDYDKKVHSPVKKRERIHLIEDDEEEVYQIGRIR